jgi:hypothetical protein
VNPGVLVWDYEYDAELPFLGEVHELIGGPGARDDRYEMVCLLVEEFARYVQSAAKVILRRGIPKETHNLNNDLEERQSI